ncbi:MAG TPA: Fic family protein [Planctomycetaceae bacterium]|nr:Fic family protein [Planctomycetaceae bacterium]
MDFHSIEEITLNTVSNELIKEVDQLASEVDKLRPFEDEVMEKIRSELLGKSVYNSSGIEGNTLTLRETVEILKVGSSIDIGKKREATESINLGKAIEQIQSYLNHPDRWADEECFRQTHEVLMGGLLETPGVYRNVRVNITGAKHQPPGEHKISNLMSELFESLKNALTESLTAESLERTRQAITVATWIHWAIARIHPFRDGNGRMARLWQDLILFGHRLTAAIIPQQSREDYYNSLAAADDGDFNPLCQIIAISLSNSLNIYLNAQRETDEVKGWASDLIGETRARSEQKRQLEYIKWSRQMNALKDSFQRCASQLTAQSDGSLELQIKPFEIIEQSTWEILRSGSLAGKTWFFWAQFRRDRERLDYCFFFGRHLASELDQSLSNIHPSPCLLVSEEHGDKEGVRLDEDSDNPISLRELLVIDEKLIRKRIDTSTGQLVYDEGIDPLKVAREFIQDVLWLRFKSEP